MNSEQIAARVFNKLVDPEMVFPTYEEYQKVKKELPEPEIPAEAKALFKILAAHVRNGCLTSTASITWGDTNKRYFKDVRKLMRQQGWDLRVTYNLSRSSSETYHLIAVPYTWKWKHFSWIICFWDKVSGRGALS